MHRRSATLSAWRRRQQQQQQHQQQQQQQVEEAEEEQENQKPELQELEPALEQLLEPEQKWQQRVGHHYLHQQQQ
eukprot:SAG11_NODE_4025_length_2100_cov_1.709145_1_plen_75_part_00